MTDYGIIDIDFKPNGTPSFVVKTKNGMLVSRFDLLRDAKVAHQCASLSARVEGVLVGVGAPEQGHVGPVDSVFSTVRRVTTHEGGAARVNSTQAATKNMVEHLSRVTSDSLAGNGDYAATRDDAIAWAFSDLMTICDAAGLSDDAREDCLLRAAEIHGSGADGREPRVWFTPQQAREAVGESLWALPRAQDTDE